MYRSDDYAKINNIIDMSVVDGPGNRTSIFFQGCQMDCIYCHNPETIKPFDMNDNFELVKDISYNLSTNKVYIYTIEKLMERINYNKSFIKGITTSGGECTIQYKFITKLFKEVKKLNLSTFVDTNGFIPLSDKKEFVDISDYFMLDIKAYEKKTHKLLTGIDNDTILKNAEFLANEKKLYEIRTVLIDGVDNITTVKNITKLLSPYLKKHNIIYKLLKYRHFGVRKNFSNLRAPADEELDKLIYIAKENGFSDTLVI